MELDSGNIELGGYELLREFHHLHDYVPTYALRNEATRVMSEGVGCPYQKVDSLHTRKSDPDFVDQVDKIHKEVMAAVAVAIGEVATCFNQVKRNGLVDITIKQKILEGAHPLSAIFEAYFEVFKVAAYHWYESDSSPKKDNGSVKQLLDAFARFTTHHQDVGASDKNAAGMISRGAFVGTNIAIGSIELISQCWKDKFDKPISPKELKTHLENKCAYPLLRVWKWMKAGDRLDAFEDYTGLAPISRGNPYSFERLDSNKFNLFELKKNSNIWNPVPNSKVLEHLKSITPKVTTPKVRGACPADSAFDLNEILECNLDNSESLGSKVRGKNSVLKTLINDTHDLALKYWLPYYEKEFREAS